MSIVITTTDSIKEVTTLTDRALVAIHKELIEQPLRSFNASDVAIFYSVLLSCSQKGTEKIRIPFSEIRRTSNYKNKNDDDLFSVLDELGEKIFNLDFLIRNNYSKTNVRFSLFVTYAPIEETKELFVQVHPDYVYLLNALVRNYTPIDLTRLIALKSVYSRKLYIKLQEYRKTGVLVMTSKDFMETFDVPTTYDQYDIDRRILKPAIGELKEYFQNLKVEKKHESQSGKAGRPRVSRYIFTFKPLEDSDCGYVTHPVGSDAYEEIDVKRIAAATGYEQTGRVCPKCGKPVYEKKVYDKDTSKYLYKIWCHPDHVTRGCSWKTEDFSETLETPKTGEGNVNKEGYARISDIAKGLFREI